MNDVENDVNVFRQHWMHFASELDIQLEQSQNLYQRLLSTYTEPQRAYHTVQHIVECLDLLHRIRDDLHDPISVEMAIWFHDVIYEPSSSENEIQSAELMKQMCTDILNAQQIAKIYAWIVATQHHQPTLEHDLQYLLDIDLAILGSSKNRFFEYEQQIRFEYAWVEPNMYQMKRREVLQHFAQMQPLYQTMYFQQYFEERAKVNIMLAMG